jgi:hypothetical protein
MWPQNTLQNALPSRAGLLHSAELLFVFAVGLRSGTRGARSVAKSFG